MAGIIDYPLVLQHLNERGFKCLYFNSGAFGFPTNVQTHSLGWIGPPDNTIAPVGLAIARMVLQPYEQNLSNLVVRAWTAFLFGPVWVMPKSHWAYELDFGGPNWLPALLESVGIQPSQLVHRNNAAAIEFNSEDEESFRSFIERLLQMMVGSDFLLVFPEKQTVCTVHSHKQIWWTTADADVWEKLDQLVCA